MVRLRIRHNAEIAHRLSQDTGKCQQIHGHGLQIELVLLVSEGPDGMAVNQIQETLEFGAMKKKFRFHIDTTYDHHLLLNEKDPWALQLYQVGYQSPNPEAGKLEFEDGEQQRLPGLVTVPGDPTVENIAKWIAEWGCRVFCCDVICRVEETATNGAEAMYLFNGQLGPKFAGGSR